MNRISFFLALLRTILTGIDCEKALYKGIIITNKNRGKELFSRFIDNDFTSRVINLSAIVTTSFTSWTRAIETLLITGRIVYENISESNGKI